MPRAQQCSTRYKKCGSRQNNKLHIPSTFILTYVINNVTFCKNKRRKIDELFLFKHLSQTTRKFATSNRAMAGLASKDPTWQLTPNLAWRTNRQGVQTLGVAWRILCTPAQQFNTFAPRKLLEIKECRTYHRIWSAHRLAVVHTGGQRPGLCAPGRPTWRCCPCCPQPPPTTSTFLGLLLFLVSVHVVRMYSQCELWQTILFLKVAGVCTFLLVWNSALLN